ncbi:hypothetical protein ATANTOWER_026371 [Ataeniobius toweri]|uniref:Secreted protein n=1 Tax=Ataeniobius toweri TaxID=208326 RepID=A0ABU7CJI3_9TELE|nr:hypothetical protein [Ataeniobius toweri]
MYKKHKKMSLDPSELLVVCCSLISLSLSFSQRCPEPRCEPVGTSEENRQRSPAAQVPPDAGPGGGLRIRPQYNLFQFSPPSACCVWFCNTFDFMEALFKPKRKKRIR